jgi:hypothetical protein
MQETQEEWCRRETEKHIRNVQKLMATVLVELEARARGHDKTKLESPEFETFVEFTPQLKCLTYWSKEYKQTLEKLWPALKHHYEVNRHHPDHFEHGVNDMTLIDILEMLADWKAATLRHTDGDIKRSIELNKSRFQLSPQLAQIMLNTLKLFDVIEPELEKGE